MQHIPYHLVHITTSGEFKTPLVASQLFDRAQAQATIMGGNKPLSVSVWIFEPMREVFNKKTKTLIRQLKKRCPAIQIHLIGGIGSLNNWPTTITLSFLRKKLGNAPVVYHCRGESSHEWGTILKKIYKTDKTVLDIRGFWPLERLSNKEIYDDTNLNSEDNSHYLNDIARLRESVVSADGVTTVSIPLKKYLVNHFAANADTLVVPCCVNATIAGTNRSKIRKELDIEEKNAILYLGGTQKYQHLEDLVLPFMRAALKLSRDTIAVFITQNKDKMLALIKQLHLPEDRIRIMSVPQTEVADYLTAMDMGLLLRAPSQLNNFAQPVKLGEYLSAGLPVLVEHGTGEVAELLKDDDIGYAVRLTGQSKESFDAEVTNALVWFEQDKTQRPAKAKAFVERYYTWQVNAPLERILYLKSLGNNIKSEV